MSNDERRKLVKLWDRCMGSVRNRSLFVGFCGGCVAVLVDFDHIIQVAFNTGNRPFHLYSLIIALFIFFGCCAYIGRLLHKSILKHE
jgi:hypothetical protein